jgi:hypothetical protein
MGNQKVGFVTTHTELVRQVLTLLDDVARGGAPWWGEAQEDRARSGAHRPPESSMAVVTVDPRQLYPHALGVTSWNFLRNVSNEKMWISKFRFEIECIIKI